MLITLLRVCALLRNDCRSQYLYENQLLAALRNSTELFSPQITMVATATEAARSLGSEKSPSTAAS